MRTRVIEFFIKEGTRYKVQKLVRGEWVDNDTNIYSSVGVAESIALSLSNSDMKESYGKVIKRYG